MNTKFKNELEKIYRRDENMAWELSSGPTCGEVWGGFENYISFIEHDKELSLVAGRVTEKHTEKQHVLEALVQKFHSMVNKKKAND